MAWGLELRVPFLDKQFLEVAMNIDPKYKEFSKGAHEEVDEDGRPKMEKVGEARTGMAASNCCDIDGFLLLFLVHSPEGL
jgi:hypothetical protein